MARCMNCGRKVGTGEASHTPNGVLVCESCYAAWTIRQEEKTATPVASDPMESMEKTRRHWHHMDANERHESAHEAGNVTVIILEEAYHAGKITKAGYENALLMLGIACGYQAEQAQ